MRIRFNMSMCVR